MEYCTATFLWIIFHLKWWDYSDYFLNFNSRIYLEGLLVFAIGGIFIIYIVAPTLDDFYNADRLRYYKALKSVNQKTLDLTNWLEYFCEGVAVSTKAVEKKVLVLTGGQRKEKEAEQIALGYKQIKVVEFLRKEGRITNRQIRDLLKVSHQTAHKILQSLIKNKVIKRVGKGRATYYILG